MSRLILVYTKKALGLLLLKAMTSCMKQYNLILDLRLRYTNTSNQQVGLGVARSALQGACLALIMPVIDSFQRTAQLL